MDVNKICKSIGLEDSGDVHNQPSTSRPTAPMGAVPSILPARSGTKPDRRRMYDPHRELTTFWPRISRHMRALTDGDVRDGIRYSELPLARMKKIMKIDDEVKSFKMISAEVPAMLAKACEVMTEELTLRAWCVTDDHRRKTMQRSDVSTAISQCEQFDFLIDIVPRADDDNDEKGAEASDEQPHEEATFRIEMPSRLAHGPAAGQNDVVVEDVDDTEPVIHMPATGADGQHYVIQMPASTANEANVQEYNVGPVASSSGRSFQLSDNGAHVIRLPGLFGGALVRTNAWYAQMPGTHKIVPATHICPLDEPDRLPDTLTFTRFDQLFTLIGAAACITDWLSDILVAKWHFAQGRITIAALIMIFAIVPSLLLNVLSATWCWEARRGYSRGGLVLRIQTYYVASLVRYYSRLPNGGIFREGWRFYWLQLGSICLSLVSLAWALAAQHRSLRFARQDKENVRPMGVCVLFLWRLCTLAARMIAITLFGLVVPFWALIMACLFHLAITLMHLAKCQEGVDFGGSHRALDVLVFGMAACVHFFTAFNVAEGRTRWRYTVAFGVELIENLAIFALVHSIAHISCWHMALLANVCLFSMGMGFMLLYYGCLHPVLPFCGGCCPCTGGADAQAAQAVGGPVEGRRDVLVHVADNQVDKPLRRAKLQSLNEDTL